MTPAIDLRDAMLPHETARRIAAIVRDVTGGACELRRIPEGDPAFGQGDPPRLYGVYEHNVAPGEPNWVFTLPEMSLDHRIVARVLEGKISNLGSGFMEKSIALAQAERLMGLKRRAEADEDREQEMLAVARLAQQKHTFRHKIGGETFIIGDTVRPLKPR